MVIDVDTLARDLRRADLLNVRMKILERMERRAQTFRVVGLPQDELDDLDDQLAMLAVYWDETCGQIDALDGTDGSCRRTGADVLDELKRAR